MSDDKEHIAYYESKIAQYLEKGELNMALWTQASLAVHEAERDWKGIKQEYIDFGAKHLDLFKQVVAVGEEIQLKMKEFELRHWMGFCDKDVAHLMELYKRWHYTPYKDLPEEEREPLRDLWDPHPKGGNWEEDYWRPRWEEYLTRRSREPLKDSWENAPCSGRSRDKSVKVLMSSSAGRVLITVQDAFPQGDKRSKFGGAWVCLIFDESAGWPRGGIQGLCATREEALGLLQTVIDEMPVLKPDNNVCIC